MNRDKICLFLTQSLSKSLEALLMYFIPIQSTLISIVFISKGAVFVGPLCKIYTILKSSHHSGNKPQPKGLATSLLPEAWDM